MKAIKWIPTIWHDGEEFCAEIYEVDRGYLRPLAEGPRTPMIDEDPPPSTERC